MKWVNPSFLASPAEMPWETMKTASRSLTCAQAMARAAATSSRRLPAATMSRIPAAVRQVRSVMSQCIGEMPSSQGVTTMMIPPGLTARSEGYWVLWACQKSRSQGWELERTISASSGSGTAKTSTAFSTPARKAAVTSPKKTPAAWPWRFGTVFRIVVSPIRRAISSISSRTGLSRMPR